MDSTIRWGVTHTHPILMIPGPTELPFPVVAAMNQPATIQYDMNFDVNVLEPVTLALRDIFQTRRGEVIAMPGSGRTALEASAISVLEPGDRALVGPPARSGTAREGRRAREAQGRLRGPQ